MRCAVNRHEYNPGQGPSHSADNDEHLEEAQEEIAIDSVVAQDIFIGNTPEVGDPAKSGVGHFGRALARSNDQLNNKSAK